MFAPVDDRLLPGYMARPVMIPPDHRRWKPNVELAPNCPRCDSSNTKFCYYNNYSLTQPRYFCKGCRRYWTKGGSLRNVPVGGGCRKNRRSKSARLSTDNNPPPPRVERALADPLRPDLALDDMVGRPAGSGGSASSLDASSSTSDGSSIDLALLYNRFLNQCPPLDRGGAGDHELLGVADPSVSGSGCHPAPVQAPDQPSLVMGELGFGMDPYIYESLPMPEAVPELVVGGGGGVFLSSDQSFPAWEAGPVHHQLGFHPAMEESIGVGHHQHHHHHQDFLIGDWTSLDQSSFEAF